MVLLGMVIGRCHRPRTNISQENVLTTIVTRGQFRASNKQPCSYFIFFANFFIET